MAVPLLETYLPELIQFTRQLSDDYQRGQLQSWSDLRERANAFYTPAMMAKIETIVPGWIKMASYVNQQTLIHVTSVLATLWLTPEYQQADAEQQTIMAWMVIFHDVAKEPQPGLHDYVHGFRGAAITGRALVQNAFHATDAYTTEINPWFTLTHHAIVARHQEFIQDNTKLPDILAGIDRIYGLNTPAGWIIKGVLLHMSLPTDPEYPTLAPLNDAEIAAYVLDEGFFPLLKIMYFVDTDSWNMFDAETHVRHHRLAAAFFERIGVRLGAA